MNSIEIKVNVNQELTTKIFIEDIIKQINETPIAFRWHYISKLLNGITTTDIQELSNGNLEVIRSYLKRKSEQFKK